MSNEINVQQELEKERIRLELLNARGELRAIRAAISANPDESTIDEVRRMMSRLPAACYGMPSTGELDALTRTAPEVIYLQISDEQNDRDEPFPDGAEVTWCRDSVVATEVRYIRADLANHLENP